MSPPPLPLSIAAVGLVTPVGSTAPASCAAFRAKISHPTETDFVDGEGVPITAHQVQLDLPRRGLDKLARMAAMSVEEALQDVPRPQWGSLPVFLCVAENERPGRLDALDDHLLPLIEAELGVQFRARSGVIAQGRAGLAVALAHARACIASGEHGRVLLVGCDSYLTGPTLSFFDGEDRLLTEENSDGFIPGEGAGAVLVEVASRGNASLCCAGLGFGVEPAHVAAGLPLRADGLTQAIRQALSEAGCMLAELDYRIADLSGEQYYFKEASLALSRLLRGRHAVFDLWHPAECVGEQGAAAGFCATALALAAHQKGYAPGPGALVHFANDAGQRAAAVFRAWGTR